MSNMSHEHGLYICARTVVSNPSNTCMMSACVAVLLGCAAAAAACWSDAAAASKERRRMESVVMNCFLETGARSVVIDMLYARLR